MKRVVITLGAALLAVLPATLGFLGNSSFSQRVPVRVPSRAILVDDKGERIAHIKPADHKVVQRPAGDVKGGLGKRVGSGDDKGGLRKGVEAGDDKGGQRRHVEPGKHVEPGDDKGGLRRRVEPGDEKGGLRKRVESRESNRETPLTAETQARATKPDVSGSGEDRDDVRVEGKSSNGSGSGSGHS